MNQLYFGDNLHVLRDHLAAESVDLIYLDPPFNSKRDYNLLFKTPKGQDGKPGHDSQELDHRVRKRWNRDGRGPRLQAARSNRRGVRQRRQ